MREKRSEIMKYKRNMKPYWPINAYLELQNEIQKSVGSEMRLARNKALNNKMILEILDDIQIEVSNVLHGVNRTTIECLRKYRKI